MLATMEGKIWRGGSRVEATCQLGMDRASFFRIDEKRVLPWLTDTCSYARVVRRMCWV